MSDDVDHNHVDELLKRPGECPQCDRLREKRPRPWSEVREMLNLSDAAREQERERLRQRVAEHQDRIR